MARWLLRRTVAAILVLWAISSIVFVVTNVFTDPATASLPVDAPEEQREQRRENLGLDRPLVEQYGDFLVGFATLDLGDSLWQERSAYGIVVERMPNTLKLVGTGMAVTLVAAIPLGIAAAALEERLADGAALGCTLLLISAPPFWIGFMLVIVFAVNLGWVPTSGASDAGSLVLPALTVGLASIGRLTQLLRRAILDEMAQPYVLTATSRGFSRSYTIIHHTLRNVAPAFVTFAGWELVRMLTAYTIVIELVFAWPGLGLLALQSIEQKDLVLLQATVLTLAALIVIVNLAVDIIRRLVDPRVELS